MRYQLLVGFLLCMRSRSVVGGSGSGSGSGGSGGGEEERRNESRRGQC